MSFALLTAVLAARSVQATSAMLVPQAPPCTIAVRDESLVVMNGPQVVGRLPLEPARLPTQPGVEAPSVGVIATSDPTLLFVGIREDWTVRGAAGLGELFEVRCPGKPAPASIRVALTAMGVDFGTAMGLPDGRFVVGGWGGLRILELDLRPEAPPEAIARLTPLTTAPTYPAGACWSATDDKPAPGADVPDLRAGLHASELPFLRGGACGYEGDMTMAPHVLDLARGIYRKRVEISDVIAHDDAIVVAAGSCSRLDAGVWVSRGEVVGQLGSASSSAQDLTSWTRHPIGTGLPIARLAHLPGDGGGRWFALSAVCSTGADRAGGDLYTSTDLETWTKVEADLGLANDGSVRGLGATDLRALDGVLLVAAREVRGGVEKTRWVSSRDATTFANAAAPRPRAAAPGVEAVALLRDRLGVDAVFGTSLDLARKVALAWTSDGLFAAPLGETARPPAPKDMAWTRILPWRGGSD